MAGLKGSNAIVGVGPPLSARGPIRGSVFDRLVSAVKGQLASELRLFPASMSGPKQLEFDGACASRTFLRRAAAPVVTRPPPRPIPFVEVDGNPGLFVAPLPPLALLAAMVQFVMPTKVAVLIPPPIPSPPLAGE